MAFLPPPCEILGLANWHSLTKKHFVSISNHPYSQWVGFAHKHRSCWVNLSNSPFRGLCCCLLLPRIATWILRLIVTYLDVKPEPGSWFTWERSKCTHNEPRIPHEMFTCLKKALKKPSLLRRKKKKEKPFLLLNAVMDFLCVQTLDKRGRTSNYIT